MEPLVPLALFKRKPSWITSFEHTSTVALAIPYCIMRCLFLIVKIQWDFSRYGLWYRLHILSSLAQIPQHKVYIKCCLSRGLNKQMNEGRTKWFFPKLKNSECSPRIRGSIDLHITVIITLNFQKFMHTFLSSDSRYCQYFTSFLELTNNTKFLFSFSSHLPLVHCLQWSQS